MSGRRQALVAAAALLGATVLATAAIGEEPELGWSDTAELSLVATGGNAEAQTVGFENVLKRRWADGTFTLEAAALRAESTTVTRRAVGTSADDFEIVEDRRRETTADRARLSARVDRRIRVRLEWFASGQWQRDEPAGVDRRLTAIVGLTWTAIEREEAGLRLDFGVTATDERTTSGLEDRFLGLRLASDARRRLTPSTTMTNEVTVDLNSQELEDVRASLSQGLAVSMTDRLALKLALGLHWDRRPALVAVPLELTAGGSAGSIVLVPLDDLDHQVTVALVVDL